MLAPRALNGGKVHSSKRLFNAIFGMGKEACTHHVADPTNHPQDSDNRKNIGCNYSGLNVNALIRLFMTNK